MMGKFYKMILLKPGHFVNNSVDKSVEIMLCYFQE